MYDAAEETLPVPIEPIPDQDHHHTMLLSLLYLIISYHISSYMIISHHISSFPNIKITQAEGAVPNLCCLQPGDHHLYHEVDGYGDDHDHNLDHEYDDVGDDCDKHDNDDGDGNSLAVQHLGLHLLWYLDPISPAVPDNHHDDDN